MAFAKKCKYGCGQMIVWNDVEGKFFEQATNEQHTKDRCAEAQKGSIPTQPAKGYFKTGQDQKSEDIKAAQKERRQQHRELIKHMQVLTKALAKNIQYNGGPNAPEILDQIGYEEYREDQQSFQDEVV